MIIKQNKKDQFLFFTWLIKEKKCTCVAPTLLSTLSVVSAECVINKQGN